jgi:hypothetical protein
LGSTGLLITFLPSVQSSDVSPPHNSYRYSLSKEAVETVNASGVEIQGIKAISLATEIPQRKYMHGDTSNDSETVAEQGTFASHNPSKRARGVTNLALLEQLDPKKAARMRARARRRDEVVQRREHASAQRRERMRLERDKHYNMPSGKAKEASLRNNRPVKSWAHDLWGKVSGVIGEKYGKLFSRP